MYSNNITKENHILELAYKNQKKAIEIINELKLIEIWQSFGAKANLVGSLKTGLLMKNRDIDFHIYSDKFSITNSFRAVAEIANNKRIKQVSYTNLIDTSEMCIEWHAWYQDSNEELWQIDMIHILNESPYAGKFEMVADRISSVLTPEYKIAILSIKNDIPDNNKVKGIEIYQAVIRDGIKNYAEFTDWKEKQNQTGIIDWMP
jgi:hypothetical protein